MNVYCFKVLSVDAGEVGEFVMTYQDERQLKCGGVNAAPAAAGALAAAGTQMVPFAGTHSSSDPQW